MELSAVFVRNYFPGCQGNFRKSFKRPWNKFGLTKSPGSPFDPNGPDSPFEPWKRDRHISIWKRYFCELNLSIVFRISIKDFFPSQKIDFIRIDDSVYDNINSRILMKDVHVVVYDRQSRLNTKRFLQTQRIGSVLLSFPTIIPNTVRKLLKICNVTFSPAFPFNPISPWGPVGPWELQIKSSQSRNKKKLPE